MMHVQIRKVISGMALVTILSGTMLAGCSSTSSTSTSTEQATTPSTQQSTTSETQSTQSTSTQASGQTPNKSQQPGNADMTKVLSRAAEILGVSADKFKTAFESAMPQGQQGQSPSGSNGQGGQPPSPPSLPTDNKTPMSGPPGLASDNRTQMSPPGQDMTTIYSKIATELGLSATDVANAMTQAQKELQK